MRHLRLFIISLLLICGSVGHASAGLRFGPRIGVNINSLHFNQNMFNAENRTGFTAGVQLDYIAPAIGLGFDISAMYVRSGATWNDPDRNSFRTDRDYVELPVNLKWRIGIPIISPYIFTGPSFAFLTSRKAVSQEWSNKSFDSAWNFGLGLELFKRIQLSVRYGVGINTILKNTGLESDSAPDIRNRDWTVTAAILF